MNVAIIGTGGRSLAYRAELLRLPGCRIAALCDTDLPRLSAYHRAWFDGDPSVRLFGHHQELLAACPDVDLVFICTPDTTHVDIALDVAAAGRAMLVEKPLATTAADIRRAHDRLAAYDKCLYLGFVLRYTDLYRAIRSLVRSGRLGTVVTLSASENLDPRHAGSFFRRWQRFRRNNGGLLNAKCCHDLDLVAWILGSEPMEVSAMGGRRIFVPDPSLPDRCRECPIRERCLYAFDYAYYERNFRSFHSLSDLCVYNSDKDIVDHESLLIRMTDGVLARFELNLFGAEETRRMEIHGTAATLEADFLRGSLRIADLRDGRVETLDPAVAGREEGHGGGDAGLVADLAEALASGRRVNHIRAGCLATLTALAADESLADGRPVRIDLPVPPGP